LSTRPVARAQNRQFCDKRLSNARGGLKIGLRGRKRNLRGLEMGIGYAIPGLRGLEIELSDRKLRTSGHEVAMLLPRLFNAARSPHLDPAF
jgi:hypothetical protein